MRYDAHNQLTAVYADSNTNGTFDAGSDAVVARYAYDALGRRIEFRNHYDGSGIYGSGPTEVATRFVYDGQNVIEEYNTNGDRQRYYVHGTSYIDERAVMHDDVGTDEDYYYLLKDLYTVVGLAQANGHELERYIYDAYGKATVVSVLAADVNFDGSVDSLDQGVIRSPSQWLQSGCDAGTVYDINADGGIDSLDLAVIRNPANWYHSNTELSASALGNPYFFTGRRRDAYLDTPIGTNGVKQIQYSRARYYNYDRWLQRDPAADRNGANLYRYGKTNPTFYVDPLGGEAIEISGSPSTRPSSPSTQPSSVPECPCRKDPADCYWDPQFNLPFGTELPSSGGRPHPKTGKPVVAVGENSRPDRNHARSRCAVRGSLVPRLRDPGEYSWKAIVNALIKLRSHSGKDMRGCSLHQAVVGRKLATKCGGVAEDFELKPDDMQKGDHPHRWLTCDSYKEYAWLFDGPSVIDEWFPCDKTVSSYDWTALVTVKQAPGVQLRWGFGALFHYPRPTSFIVPSEGSADVWVGTR